MRTPHIKTIGRSRLRLALLLILLFLLSEVTGAFAGSATWNLDPTGEYWDTASNWTPVTVPNGPNDIATFGVSNITEVHTESNDFFTLEVNGIVFDSGASAFTIFTISNGSFNLHLTISGVGISNNSGITQNFVAVDKFAFVFIEFMNSATAGDLTVFTISSGSILHFFDTSTAGTSTLIATGIYDTISFSNDSTGGMARVEVFGGYLDISTHNAPGVTVGSLEGTGTVLLGSNNLTVGSNDLDTTFSGIIQDSGSLTKIGTGTLTLSGANTYSGDTTIASGIFLVANTTGSGTGRGTVQVDAGTLGGSGIIAGAVTVGTNTHTQAILAPSKGTKEPAILTIQRGLTLNDDSTFIYKLNTNHARADEVIANGVRIDGGAKFSFRAFGTSALTIGQVFTVINNTAGRPIVGTFHNLVNGAIISINGNNLQADYQGGDGNDLTLTVVP